MPARLAYLDVAISATEPAEARYQIVEATIRATGSQMAFVLVTSHGIARMSSRRWSGW